MTRDEYNNEILEEAISLQADNLADDEEADDDDLNSSYDQELAAQITIVTDLRDAGKLDEWDGAVNHLRQMLTISYLDDSDLPAIVLRDDEAPATAPATGTRTLVLSAVEAAALAQTADAEADAANDDATAEFMLTLALLLRGETEIRLNPEQAAWMYRNAYDLDSTIDPENDPELAAACEAVLTQLD